MLVSRCVGRRQRGGGRVAPSKRDGAASSRMGVAHYNERSVFRSILGLGRTLLAEQVGPNDHAEPRASPPGALDSRSNPTGWIALLTIEHPSSGVPCTCQTRVRSQSDINPQNAMLLIRTEREDT